MACGSSCLVWPSRSLSSLPIGHSSPDSDSGADLQSPRIRDPQDDPSNRQRFGPQVHDGAGISAQSPSKVARLFAHRHSRQGSLSPLVQRTHLHPHRHEPRKACGGRCSLEMLTYGANEMEGF
jgi:hypothetical protein